MFFTFEVIMYFNMRIHVGFANTRFLVCGSYSLDQFNLEFVVLLVSWPKFLMFMIGDFTVSSETLSVLFPICVKKSCSKRIPREIFLCASFNLIDGT